MVGLLVGLLLAGIGMFAGVALLTHSSSASPTAAHVTAPPSPTPSVGVLSATAGVQVFSDDFSDPASGWPTKPSASGTTFAYSNGTYVVNSVGSFKHPVAAPFGELVPQVSITATATQDPGAPHGAGFGVACASLAQTSSAVHYEFLLVNPGHWAIEKFAGPTKGATGVPLKLGSSPEAPGTTRVSVTGDCIASADHSSVRLVMFINGKQVADVTDSARYLPIPGERCWSRHR